VRFVLYDEDMPDTPPNCCRFVLYDEGTCDINKILVALADRRPGCSNSYGSGVLSLCI
jgi:hypothetical protein